MKRSSGTRALSGLAVALVLLTASGGRAQEVTEEDALLQEKCNLCHSSKRAYRMDPAKLKETLERMRSKNPDWISSIQNDHLAAVVSKILKDPSVMAAREAMIDSLERGRALFGDKKLGKKGVSCADCHSTAALRQVSDSYPRWDAKRKTFLTLDETVAFMLREKLEAEVPPRDQRIMDLLLYLKSL